MTLGGDFPAEEESKMSVQITDAQCNDIRFLLLRFAIAAEAKMARFGEFGDVVEMHRADRDMARGLYEDLLNKATDALRSSVGAGDGK